MKLAQMSLVLAIALAGCATSQGVVQQSESNSVDDRRVAALRDGERIRRSGQAETVCKAIAVTGSRNPRRICHTVDEWIAMQRNGEETVRSTHREGTRQGHAAAAAVVSNGDKSGTLIGPGG